MFASLNTLSKIPQGANLEAELANLDSKLRNLKLEILEIEHKRDILLTETQRRQNIANPVNWIPFEILGLIFRFYARDNRPSSIRRLLLVSRAWYCAVISHQKLWTRVHFRGPFRRDYLEGDKRFLKACYDRSGDLPLEVIFDTYQLYCATEECWNFQLALGAVEANSITKDCNHIHRWHECMFWKSHVQVAIELLSAIFHSGTERWGSFHLDWPHASSIVYMKCQYYDWGILDLITEDSSLLESLYVSNGGNDFKDTVRLDARLSSLRCLELVDIGWDVSQLYNDSLSTVKELKLEYKNSMNWFVMTHNCLEPNWLQKFPAIEYLSLRNRNAVINSGSSRPWPHDLMTSYVAKSIKCISLTGHIPPRVLQTLRVPRLQQLYIRGDASDWSRPASANIKEIARISMASSARYLELAELGDIHPSSTVLLSLLDSMEELEKIKVDSRLRDQIREACAFHCPELSILGTNTNKPHSYIKTSSESFTNLRTLLSILSNL